MREFMALIRAHLLHFFRDMQALGFTLAFPLVFLVIFGFMNTGGGGQRVVRIGAFLDPTAPYEDVLSGILSRDDLLLKLYEGEAQVREAVTETAVDLGLVWDGQLRFFYHPARLDENSYLTGFAQGLAAEFDAYRVGLSQLFHLESEYIAHRQGVTPLEYMIPGIIAIAIVSTGLLAISLTLLRFHEKGVLRRLRATPMREWRFILALILTRLLVAVLGALIILLASRILFGLRFEIHWPLFLLYLIIATLGMMALGLLISLIVPSSRTAGEVSGILITVMLFFSGVYLPIEFLPVYFQRLSLFLPMSYVIRGLRYTMSLDALSPGRFWLETVLMLALSGLILAMAGRSRRLFVKE